jgi:hypothetical protein
MKLTLDEDGTWQTLVRLPSWAGYQSRLGPYGSPDSSQPSDGTTRIVFAPEGRDDGPLSPAEKALVDWFAMNEPRVSRAVIDSLLEWTASIDVPQLKIETELARKIGLHTVNIHPISADDMPYLGFEFGCAWDEDHGLGVLMHGTRLIEVGAADTAVLTWIAEWDAGQRVKG